MNLLNVIQEHRAAAATAGMAAVHFAHLIWPRLVAIYPYCRDNGGAIGIARQFLFGQQRAAGLPPAEPVNPQLH